MFANLKISEIARNPEQPRKFFDKAKLDELKETIKENGLLQPIVVRPVEGGEAPYVLIAGERRWRACSTLGMDVIPAMVIKNTSEEDAYVKSIAENVGREDMTIMEEAGAYADLKAAGWTPVKIAKQFGKTETHITWRLGLLTLRPEVADMVDKGQIKNNLAWHIAQLSPANQMVAAMRYVRGDFDSEAEAQHFANGLKMMETQTSLTGEEAPSEEEREKRKAAKAQAKDKLGKAEDILIQLFEELGGQKPEDLAVILGSDLDRYVRVVGKIYSQVQKVRNMLSKAQGIQRAMADEFNKAAVEVQQEAAQQSETKPEGAAKAPAQSSARKAAPKPAAPRAKAAGTAKSAPRTVPAQKKAEPATGTAKKADSAAAK
ncbi:ParB/RepB/Spo0J family partition protein [Streptomyces sp. NPDC056161]|uniref:ParB/RepB/Spo0J family partition protein n=1 Tax=Streptomyces sp. NPDC056161 TaxID=3345732 RepID=UPI0035DB01A4